MQNIFISTDKEKLDVRMIHQFLSTATYWSKGIPLKTIQTAIDHSLNFGVYDGDTQVGYARVISDFSTIAYLGDVFILQAYRGKGLSKLLIQEIMQHEQLQGLRRWILLTGDAQELYKKFGWKLIADCSKWMELHNPGVYQ